MYRPHENPRSYTWTGAYLTVLDLFKICPVMNKRDLVLLAEAGVPNAPATERTAQHICQVLCEHGYLQFTPSLALLKVYYPTRKGWRSIYGRDIGKGDQLSLKNLPHDRMPAKVYAAFFKAGLKVEQWQPVLRFIKHIVQSGILEPDVYGVLASDETSVSGFFENELSRDGHTEFLEAIHTDASRAQKKAVKFEELAQSGEYERVYGRKNFRVFWLCDSRGMAIAEARKLAALKDAIVQRRHMFTWHDAFFKDPAGHIWITSEDYATRTYNIFGEFVELERLTA